jgi:ankyrin repeat protein
MQAIHIESMEIVVQLLDAGANPALWSARYGVALTTAVDLGNFEMVQKLFEHNVNANLPSNYRSQSALSCAVRKRRGDLVKLILDNGADLEHRDSTGATALHVAVQQAFNSTAMIDLLLERGASLATTTDDGTTHPPRPRVLVLVH